MMASSRPRYWRRHWPTGASAGSSNRPSWSSDSCSSAAEHSMPKDSTPRSLAFLILKSSPSTAPTMAKGTLIPARALGAPHTTWNSSLPLLTRHTRSLSASGCCSALRISPTTTPLNSPAAGVTLSTSSPAMDRRATRSSRETSGFTQLRSHCSLNFMFSSCYQRGFAVTVSAKLGKEAQIVVEEQAQIVHAVTQHGQTLHAHAEGKALKLLGVDARGTEYVRVHHAATHDFQPAGLLAYPAGATAAHYALDIHLGGRLREREERGPEAHLQILLEEHLQEFGDGALEISKTDLTIHQQPLNLMEHRGMGQVGVAAIDATRADDTNRRLLAFHGPHLYRRGVGAQQGVGVEIEGIVHRPSRM